VLGSLMSRKLIATAGRKQVIGRPMQYKTTKEFLLRFGLKDLSELPSMEEFEKMAAMELSEDSLDEESSESQEPAEHSGDLFTGAEQNSAQYSEGEDSVESSTPVSEPEASEPETPEPAASIVIQESETTEATSIPTAEPSEEAAEAHDALVERQNAEEVEVEQ
jgi:segregation and condensation protein B